MALRSHFSYPHVENYYCNTGSLCIGTQFKVAQASELMNLSRMEHVSARHRYPVSLILLRLENAEKRKRDFHKDHVSHSLEPSVQCHQPIDA